ncbi:MAG TPA: hypothetical protein VJT31_37240 [Rugosimonospora sp.]|nr:hypothetical protein [Rugosimonospora sp.]
MIPDDQISAALAESRNMLHTAMPATRGIKPQRGTLPWVAALLDGLLADAARCAHLRARPVQPWLIAVSERVWRCRSCMAKCAGRPVYVDLVEEGSCDGCRRYAGLGRLTNTVIRQDFWILFLGLCARCTATVEAQGGHMLDVRPGDSQ